MFNVTGGEVLLVGLVALLVLGPKRLPDAARTAGRVLGQLRSMSEGFQREMRDALVVEGSTPPSTATPPPKVVSEMPPRPNLDVIGPTETGPAREEPDAG